MNTSFALILFLLLRMTVSSIRLNFETIRCKNWIKYDDIKLLSACITRLHKYDDYPWCRYDWLLYRLLLYLCLEIQTLWQSWIENTTIIYVYLKTSNKTIIVNHSIPVNASNNFFKLYSHDNLNIRYTVLNLFGKA